MSVLPKNRQLIFYKRNYIQDTSEIFSLYILTSEDITDVIPLFFVNFFLFSKHSYMYLYVAKRKLHVVLNTCGKKISFIRCAQL